MTTPRPDQQLVTGPPGGLGSLSGAGDLAGALGYPGVPPAVPNCAGASLIQRDVGSWTLLPAIPGAGRLWDVSLFYNITSNNSFAVSTVRTYARIVTNPGGVTLAVVNLALANPNQVTVGSAGLNLPALPVTGGTSLLLDVNNQTVVANVVQQASCLVLYSIP